MGVLSGFGWTTAGAYTTLRGDARVIPGSFRWGYSDIGPRIAQQARERIGSRSIRYRNAPQTSLFYKDNTMNKLLAALVAAVFSAGAFAQASAPAAPAPAAPAAAPAPAASAPAAGEKKAHHHKKKKKRDHRPKLQDKSAYGVGG